MLTIQACLDGSHAALMLLFHHRQVLSGRLYDDPHPRYYASVTSDGSISHDPLYVLDRVYFHVRALWLEDGQKVIKAGGGEGPRSSPQRRTLEWMGDWGRRVMDADLGEDV